MMRSGRYESSENSNVGTAITFFLIGLGAGAIAGLLLAPKAGKQLRRDLQRGYEEARGVFDDWAEDTKGRVREGVRGAGDAVRDIAARGIDLAADLAEDLRENVEPLRKAVKRS
jgi:gas vesicle protein